jgi:hypothetical protein
MRGKRAGRGVTAGTTSVAATADAAGTASFLNTPPRSSCSRQIRGSVEEVDQESKWVTARTECSDVLLPPDPLKPGERVHFPLHSHVNADLAAGAGAQHTAAELLICQRAQVQTQCASRGLEAGTRLLAHRRRPRGQLPNAIATVR